MKLLVASTGILLGMIASCPTAHAQGQTMVTGAGEAVFPGTAEFYGVPIRGFQFVNGISIAADGSAVGEFQIFLLVASAGDEYVAPVVVAGKPTTGQANADGSASFEGIADVEFGDGQTRTGAPFTATVTAAGLELSIDGADLPIAPITAGSLTVRPVE